MKPNKDKRTKKDQVNLWDNSKMYHYRTFLDFYLSKSLSERKVILDGLLKTNKPLLKQLLEDPCNTLRPDQYVDTNDKTNIVFQCGRGWGKGFAGFQLVRKLIDVGHTQIGIVGATAQDLDQVMIPTFLSMFPEKHKPEVVRNKMMIHLPNGGTAHLFTSQTEVRGPNITVFIFDELCKFCGGNSPQKVEAWFNTSNMSFRNSNSDLNKIRIITTTPKNWKIFRDINKNCEDPLKTDWFMKTGASTDNPYISKDAEEWIEQYKGTPIEQQEIYGKLIDAGAGNYLWTDELIESCIVDELPSDLTNYVIALDPIVSDSESSDEFGIIVAAEHQQISNGKIIKTAYVVDNHTGKHTPENWSRIVAQLAKRYNTKTIVAESNQGGNMITHILRQTDASLNVKTIFASTNKLTRAQPVAYNFTRGEVKIYHAKPASNNIIDNKEASRQNNKMFALENQMRYFTGKDSKSPDHLDAMVHAISHLLSKPKKQVFYRDLSLLPI